MQHGLFTVAQAQAAGYSHDDIATEIRSHEWVRVRRTVLTTAEVVRRDAPGAYEAAVSAHLRLAAADYLCLAPARPVALSHESAALLHGIHVLAAVAGLRPALTMPPGSQSVTVTSHVYRASLLAEHTERRQHLTCTGAARTVIDLARLRPFRDAVAAADSALHRRLVTPESIASIRGDCARWPGARRASRVLSFADGRAESPYESLARVVCAEQGLPTPSPQFKVVGIDGREFWTDLGWEEEWTVLEVDGAVKYRTRPGNDPDRVHYAEKLRAEAITEAGYEVVRVQPLALIRGDALAPRVWAAMARAGKRHGRLAS